MTPMLPVWKAWAMYKRGISASARTTSRLVLFDLGLVFLFECGLGSRGSRPRPGPWTCRPRPGLLELGTDVVADVDVGDVDGEDLEGGAGVEALGHDGLGDVVGVLEHRLVRLGRADGGDDALADAGDDGLFGRTTDERWMLVRTVTRALALSWMPS